MNFSRYWIKELPVEKLIAEHGSPLVIYSEALLKEAYHAYKKAFPGAVIAYAMKANPLSALLKIFLELGSSLEVVSGGEIELARHCGFPPERLIFNGNAKSPAELQTALDLGLRFNLDFSGEIQQVKKLNGGVVPETCGLRVNPEVEAGAIDIIKTAVPGAKFGTPVDEVEKLLETEKIKISRISYHLGSQITDLTAYTTALEKVIVLIEKLKTQGQPITDLDLGGGLGIPYRQNEGAPTIREYGEILQPRLENAALKLILEPGRSLVGAAGTIITKVLYVKKVKNCNWAFLDTGSHILPREAYLNWYHEIILLRENLDNETISYHLGGPLCFSGDQIARDYTLPCLKPGDKLAILHCGAYTTDMQNNYCSKLAPAHVLAKDQEFKLARRAQTPTDLWQYDL